MNEIRSEMSTNDKTDVLLAFSWINRKEKDLMIKFLELLIVDATENTNMKKRGLFMSTGIDGNGKMCIGVKCSMKNGMLESFSWIYESAMIELGLEESVKNMEMAISDQERSLYEPIHKLSNVESP